VISDDLATFAASTSPANIPADVAQRARHLILDAAGIAFASTTYDFARKTLDALASFGPGDGDVIGCGRTLPMRDAVLMNGVLIHGLDYDDTHLTGVVHASASCFPTALAVAAGTGRSGADLLAAYVIGMEAAARLGAVAKGELNQIGFHPTGVIAAFACALVAGKLYGLDAHQLVMAQGIVLSMASGTRQYSADGAWSKRLHPGWAGTAGITAAVLARGDFVGPQATYEGEFGLYATHLGVHGGAVDLAAATRELGRTWETLAVAVKPFPACQLSIACIDAAVALSRKLRIVPDEVEAIEAIVPPHAVKIVCEPQARRKKPQSSYAAQFSIQFSVACALVHGKLGLADIERYAEPALLALADKVSYTVDHATSYPKHFSGAVILTMKDGRRIEHREPINRGAADNPVTEADIVAKFMDNAELAMSADEAGAVRDTILGLDRLPDARELAAKLRSTGRGMPGNR
jgi:2-methylcitrate dehydratase PrpD